ncbi:prenyltransferase/squalene oxidase repeat-containing protein [Methanohalophilus mahii]|nr:prenyltransferase/squalene oxidase repeat-containing protein [Methanohalophilus mahii]
MIAFAMLLALLVSIPSGMAATEEEINDSITAGVAWLAEQQNPDGSWGIDEKVAHTGFAVLKLTDRAKELGYESPFDPEYEYSDNVTDGVAYMESQMQIVDITGDPADKNGNNESIKFSSSWGMHQSYNTAIALMAFANLHNSTYEEKVQDMTDWFIFTQNPDGGWRYTGVQEPSDNSNTGYVVLGLAYAEDAGADVGDVRVGLNDWINTIQDPVNGDADDGGSWYTASWQWVNSLKTGNLIFEMGFVGDDTDSQRMQDAVDYLERHWNDVGTGSIDDVGWKPNHYQAMYAIMKGLEYNGIETLEVDGSEVGWFDNFSDVIVDTQNPDGSWPSDPWDYGSKPILSTEWALLTLEKTTPIRVIDVSLDVKPSSCPNPINVDSKGIIPIAIAGSEDFDVTQIDPATVEIGIMDEDGNLIGVSPLRWSYEDVTCPYFPADDDPCCIENQPDGITDLTMKFKTQELVGTAGLENYAGQTLNLTVTGMTVDDLPIMGQDCVRIQKAIKKGNNK